MRLEVCMGMCKGTCEDVCAGVVRLEDGLEFENPAECKRRDRSGGGPDDGKEEKRIGPGRGGLHVSDGGDGPVPAEAPATGGLAAPSGHFVVTALTPTVAAISAGAAIVPGSAIVR